ncbi:MAG: nucleoside hydrolase [Planctomycetaceae bacterium]
MPQKLIIDADPGIGDALAIIAALFDPDIDLVGITATAGCVSARDASRNVQAIVEILDPPKWPRFGGLESDLSRALPSNSDAPVGTPALNGPSGLGEAQFEVAVLHHQKESAKLLVDMVRAEPNEITLLTLGPLTNVERACERAPDFLNLLKGLVCLGGSIEVGGDVTAAAEFNIYADPIAARTVLRSHATKTLVPLDVSRRAVLTFEQYDGLKTPESTRLGRFLKDLLPYAFRAHHEHLGMEGVPLQEVAALAAVARPDLFDRRLMALDIETDGTLTRGETVFDRRGIPRWQTNIEVARDADHQAVVEYFCNVLRRATR